MEELWKGLSLRQETGFRLGTDSVLLADFMTLPRRAQIVDLGSGCGTLGILLCARDSECCVTGLELREAAHAIALENIKNNALEGRLHALLGDVRQIRTLLPANSVDCVISNPPYFAAGSGKLSATAAQARAEETLPLEELCQAAAWLLPTGGRFALVHRPERLCDLFCALRGSSLEPKRIQFVRHRTDCPISLVLLEARRGGRPGLQYLPDLIQFHPDGTETEAYRAAYHRGENL